MDMEQSSSGSTNSEDKPIKDSPSGRNGDARGIDPNDSANQRMIADRLLAALASGNLENLAQARRAFIKEAPVQTSKQTTPKKPKLVKKAAPTKPDNVIAFETPADLEAQLERRTASRGHDASFVNVDEFRKKEEELKNAEAELDRRRAEVQAARRKAEEEARRKAFEESRRQIQAETERRAREEEARLAELQTLREDAQAASQQRALTARELSATLNVLRTAEQEELKRIENIQTHIVEQEDFCRRLESDAKEHSERAQWLTEEIQRLKKAEQDQLDIVETTEARLLSQLEARHRAEAAAQE